MKNTSKNVNLNLRKKQKTLKRYVQMITDFFGKCKKYLSKTIEMISGTEKRLILGAMADEYGIGGQSAIAKEFNVGRNTIRKGAVENRTGNRYEDKFNERGRKSTEEKLPNLIRDIRAIVEPSCQTEPKFKNTRLYTRLTVPTIRKLLITEKNYKDDELPTNATLNTIVNKCGYILRKVQKTKPINKIKETDAIFDNLKQIHEETGKLDDTVRLSMDAKDRVKVGNFSRGGRNRKETKACDHDFGNDFITPFGILNFKSRKVKISLTESKITADFIVDQLEEYWDENNYTGVKNTLILNCDNGPENNSRRTQFIKRIVEFSANANIEIVLAYYPPYHSKYNPVERVWGTLEQHWNGDILDSMETIEGFTKSMTWAGENPTVSIVNKIYETGKKLEKSIMDIYEMALERAAGIGKWFLRIKPENARRILEIVARC
jgi:hypothetical protein